MLFNQTAEYALRAMAHLALLPAGQSVRARDLSTATNIPADYVSKVLRRMVREGLLHSQKGHGGGFRLARAPADITFAEVLAAAEPDPGRDRCAFGWGACDATRPCLLHSAWSDLKDRYGAWAATTTLASGVSAPASPVPPR